MDLLSTLNEKQREAVEATEGPLLILAGAGSGKTRVITVRIAYLIAEKGVAPWHILAVTFTNKAAGEMRDRVKKLLEGQNLQSAPLISTFHSLCVRILRSDIDALEAGYTKSFTIYDTDDSSKVIKQSVKELGLDEKQFSPRSVLSAISAAKNRGEDAAMYTANADYQSDKKSGIGRVFAMYTEKLHRANALDFDDLLIKAVALLRKSKEVREKYNDRYQYIMVDEYQDTNALQFSLISLLTERQQNICVVGDDAQSIYSFRGADIANILSFEKHYQGAKTILLEQNYRSTQTILDTADAVIKNNIGRKEKKLWTNQSGGEMVRYFQAPDSEGEARFVAGQVDRFLGDKPDMHLAVLYRTNAQSRQFEEAFRQRRIGYNIVGGFSFYERAEVKDVIGYLKLALNPYDSIALMRVINTPPRGLGKTTLDELQRTAREKDISVWETINVLTDPAFEPERKLAPRAITALITFKQQFLKLQQRLSEAAQGPRPVSEAVTSAIEDTGYANSLRLENTDEAQGRLENLEELVNAAVDYDEEEGGLREFIDHAALASDTDQYDGNAPVTLMTVHAAKGLEFPVVFLAGLEDGIFPHSRSINDPAALEEERRLCYVAITRAEKMLYLTHAARRRIYGEYIYSEPSQFLSEMPLEMIKDMSESESWLRFAKSGSSQQTRDTLRSLQGQSKPPNTFTDYPKKPRNNPYAGKTYNTSDAINEFFKKQKAKAVGGSVSSGPEPPSAPPSALDSSRSMDNLLRSASDKPISSGNPANPSNAAGPGELLPGVRVRHSKYGPGVILRREGTGDNVKLSVSFPGYGMKKLIEKYANLELE
jgi:DNA helicase-2/ATP-dependent DNA helicase PcrA